jgi:uncharacterized RDD family membrane protein YckC
VALGSAVLILVPLWVLITAAFLQLTSSEPTTLWGWLTGSVWGALGLVLLVGTAGILAGVARMGGRLARFRSDAARRSLDAELDADAVLDGVTLTAREVPTYDPRLDDAAGLPLASPGARIAAASIDAIVVGLWFPLLPLFAVFVGVGGWSALWTLGRIPDNLVVIVSACVAVFAVVLAGQHVLLAATGQTLGKRLTGIRIVRTDGTPADVLHAVVLRWWVWAVVVLAVPVVGWVVGPAADLVLLFDRDHRTLHDLLAGTVVVDVR